MSCGANQWLSNKGLAQFIATFFLSECANEGKLWSTTITESVGKARGKFTLI